MTGTIKNKEAININCKKSVKYSDQLTSNLVISGCNEKYRSDHPVINKYTRKQKSIKQINKGP